MKDPYLYNNSDVLVNFFDEKNEQKFEEIEANFTSFRIRQLCENQVEGSFDFVHLCQIHRFIFQDLFDWAGKIRKINIEKTEMALCGLSVEYSDVENIKNDAENACNAFNSVDWQKLDIEQKSETFSKLMADLWKTHPFREGNTRTIVLFCCDFAEQLGFSLNRELFKDNSVYVRRALVAASAKFHDLGDLSQPQHLIKFIKDAMI